MQWEKDHRDCIFRLCYTCEIKAFLPVVMYTLEIYLSSMELPSESIIIYKKIHVFSFTIYYNNVLEVFFKCNVAQTSISN